jgi:hypothetical protein
VAHASTIKDKQLKAMDMYSFKKDVLGYNLDNLTDKQVAKMVEQRPSAEEIQQYYANTQPDKAPIIDLTERLEEFQSYITFCYSSYAAVKDTDMSTVANRLLFYVNKFFCALTDFVRFSDQKEQQEFISDMTTLLASNQDLFMKIVRTKTKLEADVGSRFTKQENDAYQHVVDFCNDMRANRVNATMKVSEFVEASKMTRAIAGTKDKKAREAVFENLIADGVIIERYQEPGLKGNKPIEMVRIHDLKRNSNATKTK